MTSFSEKFCLKWNDFQQSIASSYHDLRKDPDFSDVTLVCDNDQQVEAHQIILAACSPLFSTILKRNKHSHPMIYMRGIKAKDLVAIVDFIYQGEVNIHQEDLDVFLALARDLQIKGLAGAQDGSVNDFQKKGNSQKQLKLPRNPILEKEDNLRKQPKSEESDTKNSDDFEEDLDAFLTPAKDLQLKGSAGSKDDREDDFQKKGKMLKEYKLQRNPISEQEKYLNKTSFEEIDRKNANTFEDNLILPVDADKLVIPLDAKKEDIKAHLESMMVRAGDGDFKWICKVCGKSAQGKNWAKSKFNMRGHIETHVEGLSYPCSQCDKVSRTNNSLQQHVSRNHRLLMA